MDSFDDLLDAARPNPILENPFEDPFARPRSPDPWLTFSPQPGQTEAIEQTAEVEHTRESQSSVHPTPDIHSSNGDNPNPVDPLDAKAANEDHETEDRPSFPKISTLNPPSHSSSLASRSPISPEKISTVAVSECHSQPVPPSPVGEASPSPSTPPAESSRTPTPPTQRSPTRPSTPHLTSSEAGPSTPLSTQSPQQHGFQPNPIGTRPSVISPLDGDSTNGRPSSSYVTLALGGEIPGWQGAINNQIQASNHEDASNLGGWGDHGDGEEFVNGSLQRDDDDDDVPIAVCTHLAFRFVYTQGGTSAAEIAFNIPGYFYRC